MDHASLSFLAGWTNFYVIVGSSAGALTGLQFVVMTLISEGLVKGGMLEIRAFGTPTVVHFCVALLVSAIMSAPWPAIAGIAYCLGTCGVVGVVYAGSIIWHARKATYNPDAEDWVWYVGLPLVAYALLATGAIALRWHSTVSLFAVAATTLLLLFTGIHNAWDTVTYIAVQPKPNANKPDNTQPS